MLTPGWNGLHVSTSLPKKTEIQIKLCAINKTALMTQTHLNQTLFATLPDNFTWIYLSKGLLLCIVIYHVRWQILLQITGPQLQRNIPPLSSCNRTIERARQVTVLTLEVLGAIDCVVEVEEGWVGVGGSCNGGEWARVAAWCELDAEVSWFVEGPVTVLVVIVVHRVVSHVSSLREGVDQDIFFLSHRLVGDICVVERPGFFEVS